MKDCKWNHDEICVNDSCPACADFCPVTDYYEICKHYEAEEGAKDEKSAPVTNADRIRAMTDEELAEAFVRTCLPSDCRFKLGTRIKDCKTCYLIWLRQTAEEVNE